jgi:hypothetical protein
MRKFRVVNKARLITVIAILLFLVIAILHVNRPKTENKIEVIKEYTVQAGDVLWGICKPYKPSNMDLREYIYNVCEYNGCTADLQIGQEIKLIGWEV